MDSKAGSHFDDPRPGERVGPYVVLRPVARGGMASVLAVRHVESGEERGLKLLLPVGADDAAMRFRREFRALSRLKHSGILEVYEWGMHGARPWFSMELLDGRDLRDEIATWHGMEPAERWAKAEDILLQVTRALAYVHDRGLVHRDVTPGNIMVLPDGRVKLMDFGVVKDLGADLTLVGEVIGTVAYMSPEQILGDPVDARADLYSMGAVLFLMLTGKRPFSATTLQGYMEKHLHEQPRTPREVEPMVPELLDQVCTRLLEKEPANRFASAVHLLNVLGAGEEAEDLEDHWPPRSVGRTYHKARLREILDGLASRGQGAALLLTGRPGQGKTRMLDVAETYARGRGLIVARGRCRSQDRPFGAFAGVYRALAWPDAPPLLRAVMEGEDAEAGHERYPIIAAFKDLIVSRAPCVVILDDMENADPATVELVTYLIRNTLELAQQPVAFLLTHEQADEVGSLVERTLMESEPVERLVLGPLQASEVEELVLSILPNDIAAMALAQRLHEESAGSPAFVADMLRGLIDEGVIVREGERYRLMLDVHEITRSRLPVPASLRQALMDRIAPLPPAAVEVARVLAVSRRRLDLDALFEAVDIDDEDTVMEALDQLIEAGIIVERREGDIEQVDLAQGRFRDVLLQNMDPDGRRERHRMLGEVLERQYRDRPLVIVEELAYHFEQAGLAPKAYAYLSQTAARHLTHGLYEESLSFVDRALKTEPVARPQMVLELADQRLAEAYLRRSQALYHLGHWGEALISARKAERLARAVRDPRLQSSVLAELGNQLRNQGSLDEAERILRDSLAKAEEVGDPALRPMPLYELGALLWTHGQLSEAEALWREVLTLAQQTGNDRMLGYGYNGLGILAASQGDTIEARSHLEHSANLFEEIGMLGALAIARVNLVELYLSAGLLRKALNLADGTVSRAREVNHPHGIALGLAYRAQVLLAMGRTEEAQRNALEALRIVRKLGTTDDEIAVLSTLARVHLACDEPEEALSRLQELEPLLVERDTEGRSAQMVAWRAAALAALGRTEQARGLLQSQDPEGSQWPHFQVRIDLARAQAWRLLGENEVAEPIVARALSTAESKGYRFFQLLAHDELSQVAAEPDQRARHARRAQSLARSLAASLPRDDGARFLDQGWGKPAA